MRLLLTFTLICVVSLIAAAARAADNTPSERVQVRSAEHPVPLVHRNVPDGLPDPGVPDHIHQH